MTATRWPRAIGPFRLDTMTERATLIALLAAGVLVLAIASPSFGGPAPGDPRIFAADARFTRCGGAAAPARYAFAIDHARDYRAFLPLMEESSELELDDPALIVVFQGVGPFVSIPTVSPGATPAPVRTARPGEGDVCIYVGEAGRGQLNYYRDVPIGGIRVEAGGPSLEPLEPSASA
jgi:hypothetical protein